jgi:hypothetical protein
MLIVQSGETIIEFGRTKRAIALDHESCGVTSKALDRAGAI